MIGSAVYRLRAMPTPLVQPGSSHRIWTSSGGAGHFVARGPPTSLRSDNGPEFTATAVRDWLHRVGVTTLFIAPGSPWENGDVESFNGTRRDECLNRERCDTLLEAQVLIEGWRREYNQIRPHSALAYRPPAPETLAIRPPHPTPWADGRVPALT